MPSENGKKRMQIDDMYKEKINVCDVRMCNIVALQHGEEHPYFSRKYGKQHASQDMTTFLQVPMCRPKCLRISQNISVYLVVVDDFIRILRPDIMNLHCLAN